MAWGISWMTLSDGKRDAGKGDAALQSDEGGHKQLQKRVTNFNGQRDFGNLTSPKHSRIKNITWQ